MAHIMNMTFVQMHFTMKIVIFELNRINDDSTLAKVAYCCY